MPIDLVIEDREGTPNDITMPPMSTTQNGRRSLSPTSSPLINEHNNQHEQVRTLNFLF